MNEKPNPKQIINTPISKIAKVMILRLPRRLPKKPKGI